MTSHHPDEIFSISVYHVLAHGIIKVKNRWVAIVNEEEQ